MQFLQRPRRDHNKCQHCQGALDELNELVDLVKSELVSQGFLTAEDAAEVFELMRAIKGHIYDLSSAKDLGPTVELFATDRWHALRHPGSPAEHLMVENMAQLMLDAHTYSPIQILCDACFDVGIQVPPKSTKTS